MGQVVVVLAADERVMALTGRALVVADLAGRYGTDVTS